MTPNRDADIDSGSADSRPVEGALADLIKLEQQIELRVSRAKDQAEQLLEAARRDADEAERCGAGSFEKDAVALRASIERECEASLHAFVEDAEANAERYRRADDQTLARLSRWLSARVVRDSERA